MTPIPAMMCGRGDSIPDLIARGHAQLRTARSDRQEAERYVTNVLGEAAAPVTRTASPSIQHLYG